MLDIDSPIVPARKAKQLLEFGLENGLKAKVVLEGVLVPSTVLDEAGARISYRTLICIYENIINSECSFELRPKSPFNIVEYGILGYAMMASPTLEHAINIALRYYRTQGPLFELTIDKHVPGELIVRVMDSFNLNQKVLTWVIEELFSSIPPLLHLLVGSSVPIRRIEFSYPKPWYIHRYQRVFESPLFFSKDNNQFVIDNELLTFPLAQADADSALFFERTCRELLAEIERESSLSNEIRQRLLTTPGRPASAEEMAIFLNVGTRTLRRRLNHEGTSYQSILNGVRSSLAVDYLTTTELTTQEIGELLGFTEATNFRRAFMSWTNRTPKSFRNSR